jgi:hypothetical protein
MESPKIVTVVIELSDEQTVEKLYQLYKNNIHTYGARVINILNGNIPELLDECNQNYSNLLLEEPI